MWYFTWILGLTAALAIGIINVMWYEFTTMWYEAPKKPRGKKAGAKDKSDKG